MTRRCLKLLFSKFYVYAHIEPISGETMYVGMGSGGRAFVCSPTSHGNVEHRNWITGLLNDGFTPEQWVKV